MSILKKLSAPEGTLLKEIEDDITEEMLPVIKGFMPSITENKDEIKKVVNYVLGMIKEKLGDDENIATIRNIDGELVLMLLKSSETDIDLKSENTIVEAVNISELIDMLDDI